MKTKSVHMIKRVLLAIAVIIIAAVLTQIVGAAHTGVRTEAALTYTVFDTITCEALAFRNEQTVVSSSNGVLNYDISDGEKVGAEDVIADVYSSSADADAALNLLEIERKIEKLSSVNAGGTDYVPDLDMIEGQVQVNMSEFLSETNGRNLSGLEANSDELLASLNKKQVVTGQTDGFESAIAELKSEQTQLSLTAGKPISSVVSPAAGYFSSSADGYEEIFTASELENISVDSFDRLYSTTPQKTEKAIGKIVTDYVWHIACEMSIEESRLLKSDSTATVTVPLTSIIDVPATVTKLIRDESEQKAVVVLEIDTISSDMIDLRKDIIKIHTNKYTGLKVSASAIRVNGDGVKGVYILSGVEAKFVTVKLLYTTADYSVCEYGTSASELKLYDEIIITGMDLYDGKVVD